jgi:nitrogen fixation NifU-like protein
MDQLYSKKVLQHFRHPKNLGVMKNPDGIATVGNPKCGDVMRMFLRISKKGKNEYIKDVKFQTLGCAAAIATSSMITTMVKGKPLDRALKITNKAVADALGGLPKFKMHCSVLAAQAVAKAIENYYQKEKNRA